MKKHLLFTATLFMPLLCLGWGQKGHDVTASIAEDHLTETTAKEISRLLDGRSIVYWANWMDNASHTPEYSYTSTWHYRNIDEGQSYDTAPRNPSGDVTTAIIEQLEKLADSNLSDADRALALKMVVHFVGDLHQPMHMGHLSDLGGNRVSVKHFDRNTNLHGVWDSSILESGHKWTYTEWKEQLDREGTYDEAAIIVGNPHEWGRESFEIATDIYKRTPEGTKIGYNEIAYWTPTIERQLLKGGLRLAHVLNSALDPEYGK